MISTHGHGDRQHIGLARLILQGLGGAEGKALDAGIEERKPLMQTMGDAGEADYKLIIGGKHGRAPFRAHSDGSPTGASLRWPDKFFRPPLNV
ncbi:MAG TPA: hypothetical protein VN849_03385 [Stellaceae bacterium]|nr:hypothetical protein [Stellaceae bacterium]